MYNHLFWAREAWTAHTTSSIGLSNPTLQQLSQLLKDESSSSETTVKEQLMAKAAVNPTVGSWPTDYILRNGQRPRETGSGSQREWMTGSNMRQLESPEPVPWTNTEPTARPDFKKTLRITQWNCKKAATLSASLFRKPWSVNTCSCLRRPGN